MDGYVVTAWIKILQCVNDVYSVWKWVSCLYWKERIVSDDLHAETFSSICNQYANSAQTDDTESLAFDLSTGELSFALLDSLAYAFSSGKSTCPLETCRDVSCCHEQTWQAEFLYCIGIGTGSIEYHNTLFSALVERYIVYTGSGSAYCQQILWKLHFMHVIASQDYTVCFLYIINDCVVVGETGETYRWDLV